MGKYNPYRPMILGNEWAGIRPEPYQLDPETERGHTFTLDTTTTVVSGSVFLDNNPTWASYFNGPVLAIYTRGDEADAGPTRKVTIPCGGVLIVTGTGLQPTIIPGSATGVQAVESMSDDAYILFAGSYPTDAGSQMQVRFAFNVSSVSSILTNKRILDVNVVYIFTGDSGSQVDLINSNIINQVGLTDPNFPDLEITVSNVSGGSSIGWESKPYVNPTPNHITGPSYASIGNLNVMGSATAAAPHRIYPWTYNDLLRFDPGFGTGQLYVNVLGSQLFNNFSTTDIPANVRYNPAYLLYIALEVTYCDEKRLAYGGVYGRQSSSPNNGPKEGQNIVHMRTANTATPGITLPAGDYTVTLTTGHNEPRLGTDNTVRKVTYVTDALRQAYALPTHRGVEIRRTLVENGVMSAREIDVLPQIMLHTTSGPVTGVHAYGTQLATDIYGSVTLQQQVLQESGGGAVPFPQVRFYARRFGNTDVPLLLNRPAAPGNAVSITADEFDALPEIVDGWREVTLRFPIGNIPLFANNSATMTWEWSASGLTAGDQWQVLAPRSESIGGAFDTSLATFAGTTGFATYDGNVFGSVDATILFSQDPPDVTNLTVEVLSQAVTGIGEECAQTPECVPTEIQYHRVTWLPVATDPVTGFGYYELQRDDDVTNEWQTIMKATSPSVTGFSDYEARVGVESQYRIRAVNIYEFVGSWSSTVTSTIPAPGVTVSGDGNSVLIFTSNDNQSGNSNLAHTMTWDSNVAEDFEFPEADAVQFKALYQRDYVMALHPTERGGERFSRLLLINNAATVSGRIRDGFTSLRDMAWDQLSYVCVRNELGDRWFAAVQVPNGRIQRNRTLYMARVDITEVTDTPSQTDPTV